MDRRSGWLRLCVVGVLTVAATGVQLADAPAARAVGVGAFTYIADSPNNSDAVKTAVARCPAGMRVYGGGATIVNDQHRVVLATMLPFHGNGDGYSVAATERPGGHSGSWYVRAFATCGVQLPGMEIVVTPGTNGAIATCPSGKVVVGTGGALGDTAKGISFSEIFVLSNHRQVVVNGHRFTSSAPQEFVAFAAAVCASEPDGYEIRADTVTGYGDLTNGMTCGEVAIGAGFFVQTISSPNSFVDMMDTHNNIVRARVHQTDQSFTALAVQAICADF